MITPLLQRIGLWVLLFLSGLGVGMGIVHSHYKEKENLEKSITAIVQNSMDKSYDSLKGKYDDDIKSSLTQYFTDKQKADDANRLLNSPTPSWVWVTQPSTNTDKTSSSTASTSGPKSTSTVRAELSSRTSLPLIEEARRADECAVNYNKLRSEYDALWNTVFTYNQSLGQYNNLTAK